jgi:hypothetical protein
MTTVNIFYAHSSNNETTSQLYMDICSALKTKRVRIFDSDNARGANQVYTTIKEQIIKSQLVIVDITPDYLNYETKNPVYSPNVMIELGIALNNHTLDDIILLRTEQYFTGIPPSLIAGCNYVDYSEHNYDHIVTQILEHAREIRRRGYTRLDSLTLLIPHRYPRRTFLAIKHYIRNTLNINITNIKTYSKDDYLFLVLRAGNEILIIDVSEQTLMEGYDNGWFRDLSYNYRLSKILEHIELSVY